MDWLFSGARLRDTDPLGDLFHSDGPQHRGVGLTIGLFGWFLPARFAERSRDPLGLLNLWLQQVLCGLRYGSRVSRTCPADLVS